ncbi:MAG: peptidylprolyl isomerase [Planctomycetes bacterium]|nr:peptidylprolyl isomerase [Planctomycetota bacterium]
MKNSNDPGPGKYGMFIDSKQRKAGDYPRNEMAGAFGDVGFTLKLNEVGLAVHDPVKSPFGWHVIKRIE